MASEGRLAFRSGADAARVIDSLPHFIAHITLTWGDSIRIDPLAPGLAVVGTAYRELRMDAAGLTIDERGYFTGVVEHQPEGWRFRDAHWSVVAPPPAVR